MEEKEENRSEAFAGEDELVVRWLMKGLAVGCDGQTDGRKGLRDDTSRRQTDDNCEQRRRLSHAKKVTK